MTGLIPVSQFFRFFSFSSLYDRFVFICSIKSLQCTDKNRTKKSIAIFDVPKTWNFTSGGVQKQATGNDCDVISGIEFLRTHISSTFSYFLLNNALLYHFLRIQ